MYSNETAAWTIIFFGGVKVIMITVGTIVKIIFVLMVSSFIVYLILLNTKLSNIKIMLLGIAIIVFSGSVLKDKGNGINDLASIIGLSLCIAAFVKKDN